MHFRLTIGITWRGSISNASSSELFSSQVSNDLQCVETLPANCEQCGFRAVRNKRQHPSCFWHLHSAIIVPMLCYHTQHASAMLSMCFVLLPYVVQHLNAHALNECRSLRIDPEAHNFILTEPPLNTPDNREYTAEIMFETFNVPGLYIGVQAVLALYAGFAATSKSGKVSARTTQLAQSGCFCCICKLQLGGLHAAEGLQPVKGHNLLLLRCTLRSSLTAVACRRRKEVH